MNEIFVVRTSDDFGRLLSELHSLHDGEEFNFRLEPPKGNPGDITITEYLCSPEYHNSR